MNLKPFKGIRPKLGIEKEFVTLPYDVLDEKDIKEIKAKYPDNFIRVVRAEVDLDIDDNYSEEVYKKARENYEKFLNEGILKREEKEVIYIYQQEFMGNIQTGYVALFDPKDYEEGHIKKHELTLEEKLQDRIMHFKNVKAQTEPVFFMSENMEKIKISGEPIYNIITDDGIKHKLWILKDDEKDKVIEEFKNIDSVYIADGHHRTESAYEVSKENGTEIMAVVFPKEELNILPYNRLVKDVKDFDKLIADLKEDFNIEEVDYSGEIPGKPNFYILNKDKAYLLSFKGEREGVIENLEASIIQDYILGKRLDIKDPRRDERLDFLGGYNIKEKLDNFLAKENTMAIMTAPVKAEEIIEVSKLGEIMPPKSTWFEPKLYSGFFIYEYY